MMLAAEPLHAQRVSVIGMMALHLECPADLARGAYQASRAHGSSDGGAGRLPFGILPLTDALATGHDLAFYGKLPIRATMALVKPRYRKRPDITELRKAMQENTRDFGRHFGRSGRTVEDWVQGRSQPDLLCEQLLDSLKAQHTHERLEQPA